MPPHPSGRGPPPRRRAGRGPSLTARESPRAAARAPRRRGPRPSRTPGAPRGAEPLPSAWQWPTVVVAPQAASSAGQSPAVEVARQAASRAASRAQRAVNMLPPGQAPGLRVPRRPSRRLGGSGTDGLEPTGLSTLGGSRSLAPHPASRRAPHSPMTQSSSQSWQRRKTFEELAPLRPGPPCESPGNGWRNRPARGTRAEGGVQPSAPARTCPQGAPRLALALWT